MSIIFSPRRLVLSLPLATALVGCREAESISTVESARTAPQPVVVDVERERKGLDHMLTAIVPQGDKAWFFKLVVRADAVEDVRKSFEEFIGSVKLGADEGPPTWTLPAGWVEKPGDAMRVATIEVPVGDQKLPLSVSSLPLSGEWEAYVEQNVSRWMDQLQQPPLPADVIAKISRKIKIQDGDEATRLELVGKMAPAAGMAGMGGAMPAGHPTVDAGADRAPGRTDGGAEPAETRAAAAQPSEFTYDAPAGWQPGALTPPRKAAFDVKDGDQSALVTVMPFPADGPMADATMQAQRWAGQVNLQLTETELKAAATDVTIDGQPGQQFELLGPDGDKPRGIIATMVRRGDLMWFFKIDGDRALIEKQRDAFDKFLKSIKFTDGEK